ncbi:MAG: SWIM zinc finger family protein [Halobacteria archaeon]|nr:SWIM zinc finger family protein [Halobacteria archaeon]
MDWIQKLEEEGEVTPEILDGIVREHGDRGRRAVEAVSEGRVKEYRDFTVVVGKGDEYIVEDESCMCKDYEYNLDVDEGEKCWHIIAVEIAEALDEVDEHDMWYSEVRELI